MEFNYSRQGLKGGEKRMERFLEIVPGATTWTVAAGMIWLAVEKPLVAAVIIIIFDFYWLLRLFYMNIFLGFSYMLLSAEKNTDWMTMARGVGNIDNYLSDAKKINTKDLIKKILFFNHVNEIRSLEKEADPPPALDDIYHLVIVPVAKESREIVEPGIESIAAGNFPAKKIVLALALESRAQEDIKKGIYAVRDRFRDSFMEIMVVEHPDGIPEEAKVKGANATYAAKKAAEYLKDKKIPFENVIASCFDADTVISSNYFSCLAYHYIITPDRQRASFQPIPVYHNNIWKAPAFARVLDVGASFFQLIEATNPDQLVTFSSHSMSFKALVEVGYWPVDMISDDSAIFWKAFIHYDGNYKVVPMHVTLSMDVTEDETLWKTMVNVYKQKRRWAWGVENFPIVIRAFLAAGGIPVWKRVKHAFKLFKGQVSWVIWPIFLNIVSWLPVIFAGKEYSESVLYYNAQRITSTIFFLAAVGLMNCIWLSLLLLPKQKVKNNFRRRIIHAFEWLLIPPISVVFSAIPALDAQTRLMMGKYMEFWVTKKVR